MIIRPDIFSIMKSADKFDKKAEYKLGIFYYRGGNDFRTNYPKALHYLSRAVLHGYVPAHNCLATMIYKGQGIAPNMHMAWKHFFFAAQHYDPWGLYNLAGFYLRGNYTEINKDLASDLYFVSAYRNNNESKALKALEDLGIDYWKITWEVEIEDTIDVFLHHPEMKWEDRFSDNGWDPYCYMYTTATRLSRTEMNEGDIRELEKLIMITGECL